MPTFAIRIPPRPDVTLRRKYIDVFLTSIVLDRRGKRTSVILASRQRHDLPGAGSGGRPLQASDRGGEGTAPLAREGLTAAPPGTGWSNDSAS